MHVCFGHYMDTFWIIKVLIVYVFKIDLNIWFYVRRICFKLIFEIKEFTRLLLTASKARQFCKDCFRYNSMVVVPIAWQILIKSATQRIFAFWKVTFFTPYHHRPLFWGAFHGILLESCMKFSSLDPQIFLQSLNIMFFHKQSRGVLLGKLVNMVR